MSLAASEPVASTQNSVSDFTRPSMNYAPSIWGDMFLQYASQSKEVDDNVKQQVWILKEEVKKMFQSSSNYDISRKLYFIESIQRLGVSHHFQSEIAETLEQIYNIYTKNNIIIEDGGLHSLALLFRLFRQQRYHISLDVFNKFKNNKGNFNEELANDVEGMWSLFEAAQLRVDGDEILDEALEFTYTHLKSLILTNQVNLSLAAQINHCLKLPLHKGVPRVETKYYMSFYEDDPSHDEVLLNFAKFDFNILQKLYQKELGNITKWWKKSDLPRKVPYARDRLVESYIWPFAMSYEPEYTIERSTVAKVVALVCLLDDTYDAYGTVEELELFTEALQRWDISPIESLPECMKAVFVAILELCNEMELVTTERGKSSLVMLHVKQAIIDLAHSYLVEAKWCHEGYIPTYDEYKFNGAVSSSYPLQITSFIGLGQFATKEMFDWISNDPDIIKAVSVIGRVMDDMASHKFEQKRVHVASAVECCMKQYGISEEEAYKLLHQDVENCWKLINEYCFKPDDDHIPKPVVECIINLARISEVAYENFQDKFTNGELLKDLVLALLVDPICTKQQE